MCPHGVPIAFDWSEYLKLAQELAGQASSSASNEARLRTAISRAYYASHCKARNYLRDVKGDTSIPRTGKAHNYVITKFKNSSNRRCRGIGINLDRMRANRTKADYFDVVWGLSSMASSTLTLAQRVISTLSSIP